MDRAASLGALRLFALLLQIGKQDVQLVLHLQASNFLVSQLLELIQNLNLLLRGVFSLFIDLSDLIPQLLLEILSEGIEVVLVNGLSDLWSQLLP